METYLSEQHSYRLGQESHSQHESANKTSWVMLSQDGEVTKLHHEVFTFKTNRRISLTLTPADGKKREEPLPPKSSSGTLYLTNFRVIYLPDQRTELYKSFSAFIIRFKSFGPSSTMLGPWAWKGTIDPDSGGGMPACYPLIEVKLTFPDGDFDQWNRVFEKTHKDLIQARRVAESTGARLPLEALPGYQETAPGQFNIATTIPRVGNVAEWGPPPPAPDEPPPDYEEAQAQALRDRLGHPSHQED